MTWHLRSEGTYERCSHLFHFTPLADLIQSFHLNLRPSMSLRCRLATPYHCLNIVCANATFVVSGQIVLCLDMPLLGSLDPLCLSLSGYFLCTTLPGYHGQHTYLQREENLAESPLTRDTALAALEQHDLSLIHIVSIYRLLTAKITLFQKKQADTPYLGKYLAASLLICPIFSNLHKKSEPQHQIL